MRWKIFFILCLLISGCTPLVHLPRPLPPGFNMIKPEQVDLPCQSTLSQNRGINRMVTVQSVTTAEDPINIHPDAGWKIFMSDTTFLHTDIVKDIPNLSSVTGKAVDYTNKKARLTVMNKAADIGVI